MTLTLVGDPAQSIYLWRNSRVDLFLNYKKLSADRIKEFTILKNYRTPKQLVELANEFRKEFNKHGLKYTPSIPNLPEMSDVLYIKTDFETPEEEMLYILQDIKNMHINEGIPYSNFSILCRTNNDLLSFESGVVSLKIPYFFKFDSRSIMQQTGFKFLYSVYSLMLDPANFLAFSEIISPIKGIGEKFIEKIKHLHVAGQSVLETFSENNLNKSDKQWKIVFKFIQSFIKPVLRLAGTNVNFITINRTILSCLNECVNYEDEIPEKGKLGYFLKRSQLIEIFNTLSSLYKVSCEELRFNNMSFWEQFQELYETLQLSQDTYKENKGLKKDERDALGFYTIHSYKGKENPYIYYAKTNSLFPIDYFDFENTCVFYVAITRAKRKLTLTGSQFARGYDGVLRRTDRNPFVQKLIKILSGNEEICFED